MPLCEVCHTGIDPDPGYILTTEQVVSSPAYWTKAAAIAQALGFGSARDISTLVERNASRDRPWLVCASCLHLFKVDRARAREWALEWLGSGGKYIPPGSGPISPWKAKLPAALNAIAPGSTRSNKQGRAPDGSKILEIDPATIERCKHCGEEIDTRHAFSDDWVCSHCGWVDWAGLLVGLPLVFALGPLSVFLIGLLPVPFLKPLIFWASAIWCSLVGILFLGYIVRLIRVKWRLRKRRSGDIE